VLHDAANLTFIFGSFEFDGRARQLSQRGKNISLTTNEFALLKILIQCKGQVLSRAQLTGRLHSRDYTRDQRDIDMLVSRLRKQKWSGLFEQIFLIYKWKTCGVTLPLGPLAAVR